MNTTPARNDSAKQAEFTLVCGKEMARFIVHGGKVSIRTSASKWLVTVTVEEARAEYRRLQLAGWVVW